MKELDLLLGRYLEDRFDAAPDAERAAFVALLDTQDPLIYAYCLGQAPVPEHLAALIERIAGPPLDGPPPAGRQPAGQLAGRPTPGRSSG